MKKYGDGAWITSSAETGLYLSLDLIAGKNLDRAEVNRTAATAAFEVPHVFRVYTREQLIDGAVLDDQVGRRVMNGFSVRRSPDIEVLLDPYWISAPTGASHSTPFDYDAHVPVILLGAGIKPHRSTATLWSTISPPPWLPCSKWRRPAARWGAC